MLISDDVELGVSEVALRGNKGDESVEGKAESAWEDGHEP